MVCLIDYLNNSIKGYKMMSLVDYINGDKKDLVFVKSHYRSKPKRKYK